MQLNLMSAMNRLFKKYRSSQKSDDSRKRLVPLPLLPRYEIDEVPESITDTSRRPSTHLPGLCQITVWDETQAEEVFAPPKPGKRLSLQQQDDGSIEVVRLEVPLPPKLRSSSFDASTLHEGEMSDMDVGLRHTLRVPSNDNWSGSEYSASESVGNFHLRVDVPKCFRRRSLEVPKPCIHCVHLETLASRDSSMCSTPASANTLGSGRGGGKDRIMFVYDSDSDHEEKDEDLADMSRSSHQHQQAWMDTSIAEELSSKLLKLELQGKPPHCSKIGNFGDRSVERSENNAAWNVLPESVKNRSCLSKTLDKIQQGDHQGAFRGQNDPQSTANKELPNPVDLYSKSTQPTLSIYFNTPNSNGDCRRNSVAMNLPVVASVTSSDTGKQTKTIPQYQHVENDQNLSPKFNAQNDQHSCSTKHPSFSFLKRYNPEFQESSESNHSPGSSTDMDYKEIVTLQVPLIKPRSSSMDATYLSVHSDMDDSRRGSCENLLGVDCSKQQRSTSVDVNLPTEENGAYRAITHYNPDNGK